jgi:large subunit ribosomal protein L6
MSRIGKLPITIPAGVTVEFAAPTATVKGPKGELSTHVLPLAGVEINDGVVNVTRKDDTPAARAAHGLTRQLIANMVIGLSEGFTKKLELKGVGYRAATEGDTKIVLTVGFSHPVKMDAPAHTTFKVEKNVITVSGIDKQVVGEIAAQIRQVRPPEPYKGKGIMYLGEKVRRKAGKAAKSGA